MRVRITHWWPREAEPSYQRRLANGDVETKPISRTDAVGEVLCSWREPGDTMVTILLPGLVIDARQRMAHCLDVPAAFLEPAGEG